MVLFDCSGGSSVKPLEAATGLYSTYASAARAKKQVDAMSNQLSGSNLIELNLPALGLRSLEVPGTYCAAAR